MPAREWGIERAGRTPVLLMPLLNSEFNFLIFKGFIKG
jgi:hypothetical protein